MGSWRDEETFDRKTRQTMRMSVTQYRDDDKHRQL